MIGNSKNTDSAERVSTKPIKREASKTCSDSLKTLTDTSTGELSETSQPCQKLWLSASLLSGFWASGIWKDTQLLLIKSTNNSLFTERTLRAVKAEWKDSTRELLSLLQTFGILSSEAHLWPTKSNSTLLGDKTSERNSN